MGQTPGEVLADPNFKALPIEERRKVLSAVDPNFGSLAQPEQDKVIGGRAEPPPASALVRFGKGLYSSTIGSAVDMVKQQMEPGLNIASGIRNKDLGSVVKGLGEAALGPGGMISQGITQASEQQIRKAGQEKTLGKKALRYAAATPVVGPMVADIADTAGSGDIAGAVGKATGIVAPLLLGEVLPKGPPEMGPFIRTKLGPVEQAAIQEAEKRGIPVLSGQKTGSKVLQNTQQMMEHVPGASGPAQRAFEAQREAGAEAFRKLPSEVPAYKANAFPEGPPLGKKSGVPPPGSTLKERIQKSPLTTSLSTDKVGAGEVVLDRVVNDRMATLKKLASRNYESIEKQLQRHQESVQPKQMERAERQYQSDLKAYIDGKTSKPPTIPEKPSSAAPIEMSVVRAQLNPLYEELKGTMPEAQQSASPGYKALKNIMEGTERTKDALTIDKDLSAIKSLVRRGDTGYTTSASQRYGSRTISVLENQVDTALRTVDPKIVDTLRKARSFTKEYHHNNELIARLVPPGRSPIEAFQKLTATGARQLPELLELKRIAPRALDTVAQTYLKGFVEKATSQGAVDRTAGILSDWNALDPSIKRVLFRPEVSSGLDRFLLAAKKLNLDRNPSGSAKWLVTAHGLGAGAGAVMAFITGNPAILAEYGGGLILANLLSRVMFSPRGTKLLTQAVELPLGSQGQMRALAGIDAMVGEKKDPPKPSSAPPPE